MTVTTANDRSEDDNPIVEQTYYSNASYRKGDIPASICDEHFGTLGDAEEESIRFLLRNQDTRHVEISRYTIHADGTAYGSDNPVDYVTHDYVGSLAVPDGYAP